MSTDEPAPPLLAADQRTLEEGLAALDDLRRVGVDVERADSDRYWRRAALIQVGGEGRVTLVDALAFEDLGALDAFLSERAVVLHAMDNDLAPLASAGVRPAHVDDTAVAAAILGLPTGLETLLTDLLGVELEGDKEAMQRADWEARPIDEAMLRYAAADVTDLPALWRSLAERLEATGRTGWYVEELAAVRAQPPSEERRELWRVKGVGRLDAAALGRARALWQARERLARETDTAPGRILTDRTLLELAEDPPRGPRELGRRGVRRQAVRRFGEELVAALAAAEPLERPDRGRRVTDEDRRAAEGLRALRADVAAEHGLDPGVLCPSRVLLSAVLADPASEGELRAALGLREWQWRLVGPVFCEALDLAPTGTAARDGTG